MKAWIIEAAGPKDCLWSEPLDEVDAAMLAVSLQMRGMHIRQLNATRSLQTRLVGEVERGELDVAIVNLHVHGCPCGKCPHSKGRSIQILVAGRGLASQKLKATTIGPADAALHAKHIAQEAIAAVKAKQSSAEDVPVVGGFPLLDAEPPAGGWKKPQQGVAELPIDTDQKPALAVLEEAIAPSPWWHGLVLCPGLTIAALILTGLAWFVAPTIPRGAVR